MTREELQLVREAIARAYKVEQVWEEFMVVIEAIDILDRAIAEARLEWRVVGESKIKNWESDQETDWEPLFLRELPEKSMAEGQMAGLLNYPTAYRNLRIECRTVAGKWRPE